VKVIENIGILRWHWYNLWAKSDPIEVFHWCHYRWI